MQEIEALSKELEEKDDIIAQLTRENLNNNKKKKSKNDDAANLKVISQLEAENEELREKLSNATTEIIELKETVSDTNAQLRNVQSEKLETEADVRAARKRVLELEKEVALTHDMSRSAVLKSQETAKQKSNTQKQQLQLLEENEELSNKVCSITIVVLFMRLISCFYRRKSLLLI